jgi:hypothetical protein
LDFVIRFGLRQRLRVGIGDKEAHTLKLRINHIVDSIAPGTADTKHSYARREFVRIGRP